MFSALKRDSCYTNSFDFKAYQCNRHLISDYNVILNKNSLPQEELIGSNAHTYIWKSDCRIVRSVCYNITFNSVNCFLDNLRKLITFYFIATRIVISSQTEGIYIDFRNRRRRLSLRVSIVFFTWTKRLIDYEGR